MRLADAPENDADDATPLVLPVALLRGDPRLEALYAPFHECVLVSELLVHDGTAARATRQLIAELRTDCFDQICTLVREVCPPASFDEKATELDDVAAGTEWTERAAGPLFVAVYRNFGGSTALHVTSAKVDPGDAPEKALRASPFSDLADVLLETSWVEHVTCSRSAGEAPRWHLQAALREGRTFSAAVEPALTALGFENRRGKYWRQKLLVQPLRGGWLAAVPGIDFAS